MKFILTLCFLYSFAADLFAQGHDIGNGGNGVICYTDLSRKNLVSVELFDYWESERTSGVQGGIQLGAAHLSVQEKIAIATSRLAFYDPKLAADVKTIALSMANNIHEFLATPEMLPEINDANPRVLPSSPCYIEQFAVQWREPRTGVRRFAISEKFFNFSRTSNDTKAGIILHEALYRLAILNGAVDSDGVRFFNYLLATKKFDDGDLAFYVQHLQQAQLDDKRCQLTTNRILNVPIYIRTGSDFHACAPIRLRFKRWQVEADRLTPSIAGRLLLNLKKIYLKDGLAWREIKTASAESSLGSMAVVGHMKPVLLKLNRIENATLLISKGANNIPCDIGQTVNNFELSSDESILSCSVKGTATYKTKQGNTLRLRPSSVIRFDEQGSLSTASLNEPTALHFSGTNSLITMAATSAVMFDSEEKVVSGPLFRPIIFKINGINSSIDKVDGVGERGGAIVRVAHELEGRYLGKRILRAPDLSGPSKASGVCQKLGYKTSFTSEDYLRVYADGPEDFYNQVTDRFERKSDEFVETLPQVIKCFGVFEVFL